MLMETGTRCVQCCGLSLGRLPSLIPTWRACPNGVSHVLGWTCGRVLANPPDQVFVPSPSARYGFVGVLSNCPRLSVLCGLMNGRPCWFNGRPQCIHPATWRKMRRCRSTFPRNWARSAHIVQLWAKPGGRDAGEIGPLLVRQ